MTTPRHFAIVCARDERGAQLIEFALVFPLLLLITAGIVDLGLLIRDYQVITNAAREGARLGAAEGIADDIVETRVATYVADGGLDGEPITEVEEVVVPNGSLSFTAVDVLVSYEHSYLMLSPLSGLISAMSLPPTVTLKAKATMRREMVAGL
jgi:hypothetical protein